MRKPALILVLLLCACSRPEPTPAVAVEVASLDATLARADAALAEMKTRLAAEAPDFRGITPARDLDDWVLTEAKRREVDTLRERALRSQTEFQALNALTQARSLVDAEARSAGFIFAYWMAHRPAPHWRDYWTALYRANRLEVEQPDSMLLAMEQRMQASLAKGDFQAASRHADELNAMMPEAQKLASLRILKARRSAVVFVPRKTPCVPPAAPDYAARRVRIHWSEALESFYPPAAMERGETGVVILRARVDAKGCANEVAVVVHSGVPELDAAALQWFETAQFAPKWVGGPAAGEITFNVKFVLRQ